MNKKPKPEFNFPAAQLTPKQSRMIDEIIDQWQQRHTKGDCPQLTDAILKAEQEAKKQLRSHNKR